MAHPPRLWDGVLRRLKAEMPAYALEAWVRPLAVQSDGEGVRVLCPTRFHCERIRERFLPHIARCVAAELGREVPIRLELAAGPPAGPARASAAPVGEAETPPSRPAGRERGASLQRPLPHTFDSFVVGSCNALAREASLAVARGQQSRLNPLYLTSRSGLGKTHLARAIVAESRARGSGRALYVSSEAFTNEFMASIRAKSMDRFKRRFREGYDLLVVEDVQFLRAKSATQLEFFHTIAHLLDTGSRVVLTGDELPHDVAGLDPRLRSQMTAGLVAELEPPDARVRREILRSKASAGGVRLPDDCLDLLTDSVRGSVRDLEAVLIQLVASASLMNRPIGLELTYAALRKISPSQVCARRLGPREVIEVVAAFFQTTPQALASRSRRRDVLIPRQLSMYLCRRYTDASLATIARAFGREHPAVSNAAQVVERRILERAPLRYQVEALCARLEARVGRSADGAD